MGESLSPSLWISTSQIPTFPKASSHVTADVAIVGGGIVGVLCAYQLSRSGMSVVLLDAGRVLHGVTGYTTAKVSASHGLIYDHLRSQFGANSARLYARANREAIDWIEREATERGIACDFRRRDLLLYGESPESMSDLEKEADAAADAGLECALEREVQAPFETHGAVRFRNQAEFHPLAFLSALLEVAIQNGCRVYEHTRVEDVDEEEDGVELETLDEGEIHAKHAIMACHYPFFDPAFYYARLDPFRDYAVAARLDGPGLEAMFVGSGRGYTYRMQPDGDGGELLIVSGGGHKVGHHEDTRQLYGEMEAFTRAHFPVREIAYRWATQDNGTLDKVPYIGRISAGADRVWIAAGFGGWGMTTGVVASQLLADLILGRPNPFEDLYDPRRFKPITSAPELLKMGVDSVKGLIGARLSGGSDRAASDLAPGEAEVLNTDEGKVGAYRDEQGVLHAVSAVCTHMGCILAWNSAEKSWDCPCHGSRFDHTGRVLHGPAVRALEPVQLDAEA